MNSRKQITDTFSENIDRTVVDRSETSDIFQLDSDDDSLFNLPESTNGKHD